MNEEWRNELITKGAAFDALTEIESHYVFEDGHDHLLRWAKTKIFALPSAQKTQLSEESTTNLQPTCNQLATDCISRQAAIDALAKELKGVFVEYRDIAEKLIGKLPSAQPQLDAEFAEAVRAMFADIWDREIDHPRFQDTVGEILEKVIELHNSVPPMKLDEWCESCKEYDQTTHSCPRFNRVIRNTIDDVRKEAYKHGKSKGIKKGMAMAQRWIPFSERSPKDGQKILACSDDGIMWMTAYSQQSRLSGAWMPLPEPYKGE